MHSILQLLDKVDGVLAVIVGALLAFLARLIDRGYEADREKDADSYDTRLQAYVDVSRAFSNSLMFMTRRLGTEEEKAIAQGFAYAVGTIHFVGSDEAKLTAGRLFRVVTDETRKGENADPYGMHLGVALEAFEAAARADRGFPASAKKRFRWLPWR